MFFQEKNIKRRHCHFTGQHSCNRVRRGKRKGIFLAEKKENQNRSNADDLFRQLGNSRKKGLFFAEKMSVDAAVNGGKGNGKSQDPHQRKGSRFSQQFDSDEIRKGIKEKAAQERKREGHGKTGKKDLVHFLSFLFRLGGKAGDGRFQSSAAQGIPDAEDRERKLIDSHPFGTQQVGEEDPEEKAEKTGAKGTGRQKKGSFHKGCMKKRRKSFHKKSPFREFLLFYSGRGRKHANMVGKKRNSLV